MIKQIIFEDIKTGTEIPSLIKRTSSRQLVRWGCLRDEFYELHYDKDYAISLGFPDVLVQGEMAVSLLAQMLTLWLGEDGFVCKLSYNFHIPILVNEDIICKGKIVNKYIEADKKYLQCEIWSENKEVKKTVTGKVLIVLNQ